MNNWTYDRSADALYIYLSSKPVSYSREIDCNRVVDYSEDNEPRGVEFLGVSRGANIDDIPQIEVVQKALDEANIRVLV